MSDQFFRALADPSRRALLDRLRARNGQSLRELCEDLPMTRQSVTKHLRVLEAANLVTVRRAGRQRLHFLNAAPIHEIGERWISPYDEVRVRALTDLKRALEEPVVFDDPTFVYTLYIKTTPERLWRALIDPAFTRRYWGCELTSDWAAGAPMTWCYAGVSVEDPEQVVLEFEPYRRLAYTWQAITDEFAEAVGFDADYRDRAQHEPRSRVSFELEPVGEVVRLTVVHDGFEPGSVVLESVSVGWPFLLSNLKSLLETDEVLQSESV